MKTFKFSYEAVKYKYFDIKVRANTIDEAMKLADEKADEKRFLSGELHRIGLKDDTTFKYAKEHL
jgi:hypothetical protein